MAALAPASTRPQERRLFAIGLRLLGVVLLSVMLVCIKLAGERGVALPELMFWRQAGAVPVIAAWAFATTGLHTLRTQHMPLHLRRTGYGLMGMALTFGAALLLPLAEATAISFTIPIFATLLSIMLLHERVGPHRWSAIALGFVGTLVLTQPGSGHIPLNGALIGLGSALMIAFISIQLREMTRTESAAAVAFWFSALSTLPLALLLPFYITSHDGAGWLLLAGAGLFGGLGQICMTASLRFAPVSTVIGMDYSSLIWSTLYGWLIWDHLPPAATWLGAPLIAASGLYIAWREHKLAIARARETVA